MMSDQDIMRTQFLTIQAQEQEIKDLKDRVRKLQRDLAIVSRKCAELYTKLEKARSD